MVLNSVAQNTEINYLLNSIEAENGKVVYENSTNSDVWNIASADKIHWI